jgi:tRNA 2-selenouridine synthase
MAIHKITIAQFLELGTAFPVLDVRSTGEYSHAHIPGACSLPLFTDEERKVVGTAYKQQGKQTAIKIGLDYFGVRMRKIVEEAEGLVAAHSKKNSNQPAAAASSSDGGGSIIVHCWRGGMRSAGVAWLLDLYGFKVYTIIGGYKAYRKWVREQFEREYNLKVLGGYTGSGKTLVLHQLQKQGYPVIDLEALANHKGSAFGAMGEKPQPSQEMFENLLAKELYKLPVPEEASFSGTVKTAFVEDESQRIGKLNIPGSFWGQMRKSPVLFLEIPFEKRLGYLAEEYGKFEKEKLVNAIIRIQKRLGGLETKTAINFLLEDNPKECFRTLLKYYDKLYVKGLQNRENLYLLLTKITVADVDATAITNILLHEKKVF